MIGRRLVTWLAPAAVCGLAAVVAAQGGRVESAMSQAAREWLATLTPELRAKAVFPFDSPERMNWHFIPRERNGVSLKMMNEAQRRAALAFLRTGLSENGDRQTALVRELEKVLLAVEKGSGPVRDPDLYFLTVFGEPGDEATWGWRYEGHHCSLNYTVVKGRSVAGTPQFHGANPAEVRVDVEGAPAKGTRALAGEEDTARALLMSLTPEQKKQAVLEQSVPQDIFTAAQRQAMRLDDRGIAYGDLNDEQKRLLRAVVREYLDAMPREVANARVTKIQANTPERVRFAWIGSEERGRPHYYRIQGPTFLIEYDNIQNNANHIHAVWRDFQGDFGADLLAMHYRAFPHRIAAARATPRRAE